MAYMDDSLNRDNEYPLLNAHWRHEEVIVLIQ